jgi:helicase associated protein
MARNRARALAKNELDALPETRAWPPGATPSYSSAYGTWEGCGYDNLVMSASLDRYFVGPQAFDEVIAWYEKHLTELGWPAGTSVDSANGTRWHRWRWALETIELIDRVIGLDHPLALTRPEWRGARLASELPPGSWAWSLTYQREPPPGELRPAKLTPPSDDEKFDETFRLLEKFVAREGHADIPSDHVEDGVHIGTWVANMRYLQANASFRTDWAERLTALRGWRWLSGNDLVLFKRFALREGHISVPEDHYEEGRPLGLLVREWRQNHRKGGNWRLTPELEHQLESIDGWEW